MKRTDASVRIHSYPNYCLSSMCKWLGRVEQFHQQLKSFLRTDSSSNWVDLLPLILLGVHTALKEDIGACAAELVYGTTLRIPGAFFASLTNASITDDPANYVTKFKDIFRDLKPDSPHLHNQRVFVHKDLMTTSHVFFYTMILYVSRCNHLIMGHIRFSSALTSISPLQSKERMKLFLLID